MPYFVPKPRINYRICIIAFLLITVLSTPYSCGSIHKFHPAQSDAEKKLDKILHFDEDVMPGGWCRILHYIKTWPHTKSHMKLEYEGVMTKGFIYAWSMAEQSEVNRDCGGRYLQDALCGIDCMILVCGQDYPSGYFYRTLDSGPGYAIIEFNYRPRLENKYIVGYTYTIYRMVKSNNMFLLDGMQCIDGSLSINMKYP